MNSTYILLILIVFSTALGCKSKFDSTEWNEKGVDWQWTDVREKMLDNLIESDTLIGMDTSQLYKLLGQPESVTDSSRFFLVRERYTSNIDPDYIKYLNVIIDGNKVRKCEVYQTK